MPSCFMGPCLWVQPSPGHSWQLLPLQSVHVRSVVSHFASVLAFFPPATHGSHRPCTKRLEISLCDIPVGHEVVSDQQQQSDKRLFTSTLRIFLRPSPAACPMQLMCACLLCCFYSGGYNQGGLPNYDADSLKQEQAIRVKPHSSNDCAVRLSADCSWCQPTVFVVFKDSWLLLWYTPSCLQELPVKEDFHLQAIETTIDHACPQKAPFEIVRCTAHQHFGGGVR